MKLETKLLIATAEAFAVTLLPPWTLAFWAAALAALIGALLMGRRASKLELTPIEAISEIGLCGALGWAVQGILIYRGWQDTQFILIVSALVGSTGSRGLIALTKMLWQIVENLVAKGNLKDE